MLAGATGIDFVLLVVAADDGVMPQTREHLAIVDLLGDHAWARRADQDRSRLARATRAVADAIRATPARDRVVLGAHRAGVDRDGRRHRRAPRGRSSPPARAEGPRVAHGRFRLAVDRCFSLTGLGHDRDGRRAVRRRRGRRRGRRQPGRPARARALDPFAEQSGGARRRRRALRAQSRRRRRRPARDRARRRRARSGAARADRPHRRDAASCSRARARPLAHWTPVRLHHAAAEVARARRIARGRARSRRARAAACSSCWSGRSRPRSAIASCCATRPASRTIGGGHFVDLRAAATAAPHAAAARAARCARTRRSREALEAASLDAGRSSSTWPRSRATVRSTSAKSPRCSRPFRTCGSRSATRASRCRQDTWKRLAAVARAALQIAPSRASGAAGSFARRSLRPRRAAPALPHLRERRSSAGRVRRARIRGRRHSRTGAPPVARRPRSARVAAHRSLAVRGRALQATTRQ